ncbi:MAG: PocR ligand-binding domain-containing protein [Solidesulfovibrio sp. DCME]|uniref:PocR ligand-binding domain-containing protein n=1 Tax=Solidesulfovibrio sp. DCME TaxID=3447380 RepID=UPI003D0A2310
MKESIQLVDLIPKEKLDEILQAVNEACGIGSVIADTQGRPISSESNFCSFCKNYCRATPEGRTKCYASDAYGGRMSLDSNEPYVYDCLNAGLVDCATPIIVAGQHIGNLNGGQVLEESISTADAVARAKGIGITDIDGYLLALRKIPRVKRSRLQKIVNLMSVITQSISDMALQRIMLSRQSQEYLNKLINSVSDCIISVDTDFIIDMSNDRCSEVFGCGLNDFCGQSLMRFVQDHKVLAAYKSSLEQGGQDNFRFELTALTTRRTPFPVQISISRVNDESGKAVSYVAILRDITEEKRIAKMKEDLVGMLTHDMRNPILAIDRALELLAGGRLGPITDNQEKILKLALNTNDQLGSMVNAFLDIFRDENGRFELHKSHYDINKIINQCIEEHSLLAEEKGLDVRFFQRGQHLGLFCDLFRVKRTISNILSNAINYNVVGGNIQVSTTSLKGGLIEASPFLPRQYKRRLVDSQNYVWMVIADTGFGVPEAYQETIFEKFFTVQTEAGLGRRGIGLGLAFSKLVAEAHDGFIFCRTPSRAPAQSRTPGVEFHLVLPSGGPAQPH